jgi:hypothetical protein
MMNIMSIEKILGVVGVVLCASCGGADEEKTTGSMSATETATTSTVDVGVELVPREISAHTLTLVLSADGVMALNQEGETVHFDPWWAQVTTESCFSGCGATGIVATTEGFLAGYSNLGTQTSGVLTYVAGTASIIADSVSESASHVDLALDYTGMYWVTVSADANAVEWVSRDNPEQAPHALNAQHADWDGAEGLNTVETFNYNGQHLMLLTNEAREGQANGSSQGSISLWDVDSADAPSLMWRFPETHDLAQPRGGTLRIVDDTLYLFYAQIRDGVGSVGVAELSDMTSSPIIRANLAPPSSLREWVNPVSVEVADNGTLFVVDQGTPFGEGPDHDRGWVFKGNLPAFGDSIELMLSEGTELVYYVGTPTEVRLWSGVAEAMAVLPPEPVYVSVIMHNEEPNPPLFPDYLADEDLFWSSRASIVEYARLLQELGLPFNWQSDWNFLMAVADFDEGTPATNNKNVVQWLREDLGFSIDPHAHETEYNYADVAYLMEALGGQPSGVVGGLIVDPPEDSILEYFFTPITGEQYPSYTWQPEILWGGGTKDHLAEYDVMVSGIWNPLGVENYLVHDEGGPIPHVGKYKAEWSGLNILLEKSEKNWLRRGRMHTLSIGDGLIVFDLEPTFVQDQQEYFQTYLKRDDVVFVTLQDAVEVWRQQYNSLGHAISFQQHADKEPVP